MINFPITHLKDWFLANRRSLPWRRDPTPYKVWVSEIMLQQTQVAVVIPYFERWMEEFPNIERLAQTPLEKILKCWEGLGYYSRARNLLKGAIYVMDHYQGIIPSSKEQLAKIPGIGPYTLGAILSFAFHQKEAAVDGNVLRVLSRFCGYLDRVDTTEGRNKLHCVAQNILPEKEPWIIAEGVIELGALVCTKMPKCMECPLQEGCYAFKHHLQHTLPRKNKSVAITHLTRHVAVISHQEKFLIEKREEGNLMGDLYEYPYFDGEYKARDLTPLFENKLALKLQYIKPLPVQYHSFTRFRATLIPHLFTVIEGGDHHVWRSNRELTALPFSSGHKRILADLLK